MHYNGPVSNNLFAFDSKVIVREWVDGNGVLKRVKVPIAVCVNPQNNSDFEEEYDRIMDDLFNQFKLQRTKPVYCSSEIGMTFGPKSPDYENFCIGFMRRIMNVPDVKFSFFFTSINPKYLVDGKVIINGDYGSSTRSVIVDQFIDEISNSYNTICAWKLMEILKISKQNIFIDGTTDILDSVAWRELSSKHNVKIVFNGDRTNRAISASDLILRSLTFFLNRWKSRVDENSLKKMVHHKDKIPEDASHYIYIGNPDLDSIKPCSDRHYSTFDLRDFIQHPIIYLYAGKIEGQKSVIGNGPESVYDKATSMRGGVKIFDPKQDSGVIGSSNQDEDYFVPLNEPAEQTLEALVKLKKNVKRFEL